VNSPTTEDSPWNVEPSEDFRVAYKKYYDGFPRKYPSERDLELHCAQDDKDLKSFTIFTHKMIDVTQRHLNPETFPQYNRNGNVLPDVRVLRCEPWSAFYQLKKPDRCFGLSLFHDDDLSAENIEALLARIEGKTKNAK
jgi:hypothetical protein